MKQGKKINKTACVHYVVPKQQTKTLSREQKHNKITTPQCCNHSFPTPRQYHRGSGTRVTAVIAWGKRPVPFRTRKLRPTAPMVLHPGGCGRVGHRRTTIRSRPQPSRLGPPTFNTTNPQQAPRAGRISSPAPGPRRHRRRTPPTLTNGPQTANAGSLIAAPPSNPTRN